MSAAVLAEAVRRLPASEHEAFLDALLSFDAEAIRQRLEDRADIAAARAVLESEKDWLPWHEVKAGLHEVSR